jgi:hypothetical protein
MNPWRWVDPRVAQVRVAGAKAYLLSRGWSQTPSDAPHFLRFESPSKNSTPILYQVIPASDNVADLKQSIIYLLTTLSEIENRHPVEILNDILHQRVEQPPTPRLATTP